MLFRTPIVIIRSGISGGYFGRGVPAGFTVVWDVAEADSYDHIFYCNQQVLHNSANNSDKAAQYKNAEIQYYDFVLHIGANIDDEDIYTNVKDFLVCESFAEIPSVKITVTRFFIECAEIIGYSFPEKENSI